MRPSRSRSLTLPRALLPVCAVLLVAAPQLQAQSIEASRLPAEIETLFDSEPLPEALLDPTGRFVLLVHEHQLLSIASLAEPAVDVAGRRINPGTASTHAPRNYYGLSLLEIDSGMLTPIPLPPNVLIGFPSWSADGRKFAFAVTRPTGTEMWVGDVSEGRARMLVNAVSAVRGAPCTWAPDGRRLYCKRIGISGATGREILRASVDLAERLTPQAAVGLPTIQNPELTRKLLETNLELVDATSGQRRIIGSPAAYETIDPAPGGAYLLVDKINQPYPSVSGVDTVLHRSEIIDRFGRVVASVAPGARAVDWQPSEPGTLTWIATADGRDHVMRWRPPFDGQPERMFSVPHRFAGLRWFSGRGAALVGSYDATLQRTELWYVDGRDPSAPARSVSSFDSLAPRIAMMTRDERGRSVLVEYAGGIFLRSGGGQSELVHVSVTDGTERVVWTAGEGLHETVVDLVAADGSFLLTRADSADSPPHYNLRSSDGRLLESLPRARQSASTLSSVRHMPLRYLRHDGVQLSASLYLPPDAEPGDRLPTVLWSYPRRVADSAAFVNAAGPDRYPGFERAFRLFFVLNGYAVLDEVAMPIVGQSDANDTFIEQIVANADAALAAAYRTGFVDRTRVGVAGHSYGAFMAANLLAHSRLFSAGIALSGAYNRTLTPFGFQTERRTLWEARDTYLQLSPLLYSHQIEAPLLIVHGMSDDNAGASPLQSTQFYQAIRGNNGAAELLLLPWEGHTYRARESVFESASRMLAWFDRYLKVEPSADTQ